VTDLRESKKRRNWDNFLLGSALDQSKEQHFGYDAKSYATNAFLLKISHLDHPLMAPSRDTL